MMIQFDGEVADKKKMLDDLKLKGYDVIGVHPTRWFGVDDKNDLVDRGGRIDVEIADEFSLPAKKAAKILLEADVIAILMTSQTPKTR